MFHGIMPLACWGDTGRFSGHRVRALEPLEFHGQVAELTPPSI